MQVIRDQSRSRVGLTFGWRSVFMLLGVIVAIIAVLSHFYLPVVKGEQLSQSNSPLAVLKMPSVLIVLLLTFLSVAAHYGIYTYIALLVEMIGFAGGIGLALLLFGIGSVISVVVSAKYIDVYLRPLIVSMLAVGATSMGMFLNENPTAGIRYIVYMSLGCFVVAIIVAFLAKRTLRPTAVG